MRVICTDDTTTAADFDESPFDVWFGKTYTVLREVVGFNKEGKSSVCYVLAEFPDPHNFNCWPKFRFTPLSEIDEEEIVEQGYVGAESDTTMLNSSTNAKYKKNKKTLNPIF